MQKSVESDENIVRFMNLCGKIEFLVLKFAEIAFPVSGPWDLKPGYSNPSGG
jgi:hypothetical protein